MNRRASEYARRVVLPRHYELLLARSRDAGCATDTDGRIIAANDAFRDLIGDVGDISAGHVLSEFMPDSARQRLDAHLAAALAGGAASATLAFGRSEDLARARNLISIPMFRGQHVNGVLTFVSDQPGTERDERLQTAVYEIASYAGTIDNLDKLFPAIHRTIDRLMAARNFFIALYDPVSDMVEFPYFVDKYDDPPPPVPMNQGASAWIVRHRRSLLANEGEFERMAARGELELKGRVPNCWMGAPLVVRGEVIGVIAVQDYRPASSYDARDLQILEFVSSQIALVIQRKRAEQAIRDSERHFREVLDNVRLLAFTCDTNGAITYCNEFAQELTGLSRENLLGRRFYNVLIDSAEMPHARAWFRRALRRDRSPPYRQFPLRAGRRVVGWNTTIERDANGRATSLTALGMDLTASHEAQRALTHQARHDPLTGLVNRREFEARLEALRVGGGERGQQHALLYIDLDQFKVINDTCGHMAGDELLKELAVRMGARIRATDTLARLGGDEFGVLLSGCPLPKAEEIAGALLDSVRSTPFRWEGKVFAVGASIGLMEVTGDEADVSELLRGADMACYLAKEQGRNRITVYRAGAAELATRRAQMDWVSRIGEALADGRFHLYYQRIVSVVDGRPGTALGAEILLRLAEQDGTVTTAGAFVPAAERYGLMPEVDRWVVEQTLRRVPDIAPEVLPLLAVNLSATSINNADFCRWLVREMKRHPVEAARLVFEVTETAAIANLARSNELIEALTAVGCHFALDDFGSGFASFSYLKGLAVGYVKIDGSFVVGAGEDPVDTAMIEAITQMAHLLEGRTIAESVEQLEQLSVLEALGVDYVQGFGIHRPEPLPG